MDPRSILLALLLGLAPSLHPAPTLDSQAGRADDASSSTPEHHKALVERREKPRPA